MTPGERRKRKSNGEQSAREARSGRLPDWHPREVAARAKRAAEEKAASMLRGRDPQGQQVQVQRETAGQKG